MDHCISVYSPAISGHLGIGIKKHSIMSVLKYFIVLCAIFGLFDLAYSVELTFELPDSAKQCFFQEIEEGVESTIEFQVKEIFEKVILFKE